MSADQNQKMNTSAKIAAAEEGSQAIEMVGWGSKYKGTSSYVSEQPIPGRQSIAESSASTAHLTEEMGILRTLQHRFRRSDRPQRLPSSTDFSNVSASVISSPGVSVNNVVVLLRDSGGNEEALAPLVRDLRGARPATAFVLVQPPLRSESGSSYDWYNTTGPDHNQALSVLKACRGVIVEIVMRGLMEKCSFQPEQIVLLGHGQGAAVALGTTALTEHIEFGGVVFVDGTMPICLDFAAQAKSGTPALARDNFFKSFGSERLMEQVTGIYRFTEHVMGLSLHDQSPRLSSVKGAILDFLRHRLDTPEWTSKAILSLDGGGVRSYGSLLILKALMRHIEDYEKELNPKINSSFDAEIYQPTRKGGEPADKLETKQNALPHSQVSDELPTSPWFLPCHYFDFVAGAGTGGLVATMLSRFRMTIDDCTDELRSFCGEVFGHPRPMASGATWHKFNHKKLEDFVNYLTQRYNNTSNFTTHFGDDRYSSEGVCNTLVLAHQYIPTVDANAPFLFRTYSLTKRTDLQTLSKRNECRVVATQVPVWKTLRAAMAAPGFFRPIEVGNASGQIFEFRNQRLGPINPSYEAYREVVNLTDQKTSTVEAVISIGVGKATPRPSRSSLIGIRNAFTRQYVTDTVHRQMIHQADWDGERAFDYYRFDGGPMLDQIPMVEWKDHRLTAQSLKGTRLGLKTIERISIATSVYLGDVNVQADLRNLAKALVHRRRLRTRNRAAWDRYALVTLYHCDYKNCGAALETPRLYESHLSTAHDLNITNPSIKRKLQHPLRSRWTSLQGDLSERTSDPHRGSTNEGFLTPNDTQSSSRSASIPVQGTSQSSLTAPPLEMPAPRRASDTTSLNSSVWTASTATRDPKSSTIDSNDTADSSYLGTAVVQDQMTQISQEMMNGLQSSAESTRSITIFIHWDFQQYFKEGLRTGQSLAQILTLSGNTENAYATSYAQYVQWLWPETGMWILEMIERVVLEGRHQSTLPIMSQNTVSLESQVQRGGELLLVTASGSLRILTVIAQQLVWLTAVMRVHQPGILTYSNIHLRYIGSITFEIVPEDIRQVDDSATQCWHPLFESSSLAFGFPVPDRDGEKGLELSFDMMLRLASITYAVTYDEGLVLSGFSAILFPTGHYQEENCHSIQWHLVQSEVEHTPIAAGAILAEFDDQWVKISDIELLRNARTFLGYCSQARVHLGSENSGYDSISASGLSDDHPGPEISVHSGSIGTAGTGIFGCTLNIDVLLPSGMARSTNTDHYNDILRTAKNMPVILYNSERQQGWLVSTLSVILHMAHAWVRENSPSVHLDHAEPHWDGGQAAYDTIVANSQMKLEDAHDGSKPRLLKDIIERLWEEIISCFNATDLDNRRLSVKKSRGTFKKGTPKLRGWEYTEIIDPPPGRSRMKQQELREGEFGWNALNEDVLLLVCKDLSEVIRPANPALVCREFYGQDGQNILTASLVCLQQLSKRRGAGLSCSKLTNQAFWNPSTGLFDDCIHGSQKPCPKPLQALVERPCLKPRINVPDQGAVIFGYRRNKLKKNTPTGNSNGART